MRGVKTRTVLMAVAALLAAAPVHAAGNTVDVFDHPLKPVLNRDEPKLILYASQGTQNTVSDAGSLLAAHLKGIPYITVVHVDLRGIPGFLMGFARRVMQGSQSSANEQYADLARAAGLKPPPASDEHYHVVMEPDGAAHQSLGMPSGFRQAMAVVLDRAGREILRARFPQDLPAVEKALQQAAQQPPAESHAEPQKSSSAEPPPADSTSPSSQTSAPAP
jgi:hypothetical protein